MRWHSVGSPSQILVDVLLYLVDIPIRAIRRHTSARAGSVDVHSAPPAGRIGGSAGDDGTPTRIHLCGLPDLRALPNDEESSVTTSDYYVEGANGHALVNARISGAAFRMVEAAKAAGVTLTATSSFRRDDHQRDLYDCYVAGKPGCSQAAEPGYSSHQMGLAIDFVMPPSTDGCSGGAAADDSSWKWLHARAGEFSFRQLKSENWHWDTSVAGQEMC